MSFRWGWRSRAWIAVWAVAAVACGGHAAGATTQAQVSAVTAAVVPSGDWLGFDYNAQRSGVGPASTGIDSSNLGSLSRRVVQLGGVADSSAVELHAVRVGGRVRDAIFLTTTYGRTLAIDPGTGRVVWEYVPHDIAAYRGGPQITTATPILDPDRAYLYAASPDGRIHKLAVGTGAEVHSGHWPVRVTFNPAREKIVGALNISRGSVVVTTGGYYGDAPPYQGHV